MPQYINGDVTSTRSLFGADNVNNSEQLDAIKDYYRFQILYTKVLKSLNTLIASYTSADMNTLIEDINTNNYLIQQIDNTPYYYNDDVTTISGFDYDPNLFNDYKTSFKFVLTGLNSAIAQYRTNLELTDTNANLLIDSNILNGTDKTLITRYIIQKNTEGIPFDANSVLDLDFDIKIWYSVYLTRHGAPPDGVFDTEKLSIIVSELISDGIITIDEFISDRLN
uniref:Uncharacterized protein n=1 Tax=viral metagenome TaxID=1070528 RepID=A0A6C0JII7_9ZZZZ